MSQKGKPTKKMSGQPMPYRRSLCDAEQTVPSPIQTGCAASGREQGGAGCSGRKIVSSRHLSCSRELSLAV